jgi:hypothetical protein
MNFPKTQAREEKGKQDKEKNKQRTGNKWKGE